MLEQFYEECLRFWKREGVENPEEMALNDVKNLKHNSFSPQGDVLHASELARFIENKLNNKLFV